MKNKIQINLYLLQCNVKKLPILTCVTKHKSVGSYRLLVKASVFRHVLNVQVWAHACYKSVCHVLSTQSYETAALTEVHAGGNPRHTELETHADWLTAPVFSYQLPGWRHGWTLGPLQDLLIGQTSPVFTLALQIQNWANQRPFSVSLPLSVNLDWHDGWLSRSENIS